MSPLEVILSAAAEELTDEDGKRVELVLTPGLTDEEVEELAARLPCDLPEQVRALLAHCRGFEGSAADIVDFTGDSLDFEQIEVFPHGLPIAGDGYGNFWVADLHADSVDLAPIYFACHDAPVILYQSPTLEHFLTELFKSSRPPHASLVDDVHEDRLFEVWWKNPEVLTHEQCLRSPDAALRDFAEDFDETWELVDLRNAEIGQGFSWGRYGPRTEIRRCGSLPIFAIKKKKGLLQRIFGK